MEEKKKNWFDRATSHPIFVIAILLLWIRMGLRNDWSFAWWQWVVFGGFVLWLTGMIANKISGNRISSWWDRFGEGDLEIPESLMAFKKQTSHSSIFVERLDQFRNGEREADRLLDGDEENEEEEADLSEVLDGVAVLSLYREFCDADNDLAGELSELFRSPGSQEVFSLFYQMGMPLVLERYRQIKDRGTGEYDHNSEKYQLLALLTGFAFEPAFDEIRSASRNPEMIESYMWGTIFSAGNVTDPDFSSLLRHLGKELPEGFACVAFLDQCNAMCLEHEMSPHPFASDAGMARLKEYLSDSDPEHFTYAISAASALPHLSHPLRNEVLALAIRHPDLKVQVEAAWAGSKLGKREYIDQLAAMSTDWRTGGRAIEYLEELDLNDNIPDDAKDSKHRAKCEVADWLQHPNELAKLPDDLDFVDQRKIYWPPCEEDRTMSILKWMSKDKVGIVVTGGVTTWCFFSVDEAKDPLLDIYARHCNWQMSANEIEGAPESYNELDFGRDLLKEKNPDEDWSPQKV